MKNLLVYCYFCPDNTHRAGGVQQIVSPLLSVLEKSFGWSIKVLHPGACYATSGHINLPEHIDIQQPDAVDPEILSENIKLLRKIAADNSVILSIDRMLPSPLPIPCVLMSNTLAYFTEAIAVQANQWVRIVVPTFFYAEAVHVVNPITKISVVPYGFTNEFLQEAHSASPIVWDEAPIIVKLPHRPDPRKGHIEAIEGLAQALPKSKQVKLEISWLDEKRYNNYFRMIEKLAVSHGVATQISFCGWLNDSERLYALKNCCAVIQLGSFQESFGLAIVESIIFGRPALTRYQPSVREIVGPIDMLLEIGNPKDWYHILSEYCANYNPTNNLSFLRHRLARKLEINKMAASYDEILSETIEMRR